MKSWKRLFFYLLLNVLVSALTTLTVLWAWDYLRGTTPFNWLQPLQRSITGVATPSPSVEPNNPTALSPTPTLNFIFHPVQAGDTFETLAEKYHVTVDDLVAANGFTRSQPLGEGEMLRIPIHPVVIDSVIGPGDLASESVILRNDLDGEITIAGWKLEDETGNSYTFPQVTIFVKGGTVTLHTKAGTNTVNDLNWGLTAPVWLTGTKVVLRDAQGRIQDSYIVP